MTEQVTVMRRPRLYRDRRWIEGYASVARGIQAGAGDETLESIRLRLRAVRIWPPLTAWEKGAVDAMLDAVGC